MVRRIRVQHEGVGYDVVELPASSEYSLQEIVKANPQLLPADDLGFDDDLAVVGRETTLASGAIDLLCLARTGDLVLVEFKTGPQNPDFRSALAQVIDYGSDLWGKSVEDFDRGVVQRYLASGHSSAGADVTSLGELVDSAGWDLGSSERESLFSRLEEVLLTGDFTFVVAAQRFVTAMRSSVDYLNEVSRRGRYFLIEVIRLEGQDPATGTEPIVAHLANIVAAPPAQASSSRSAAGRVDETRFLQTVPEAAFRETLSDLFAAAGALGMRLAWGAKGTSIRMVTPDRAEPLSIGWAYPAGTGWAKARHLTLGVDDNSLTATPSVQSAVEQYLDEIGQIPGGVAITMPRGFIFEPTVAPSVKDQLIAAITRLRERTDTRSGTDQAT